MNWTVMTLCSWIPKSWTVRPVKIYWVSTECNKHTALPAHTALVTFCLVLCLNSLWSSEQARHIDWRAGQRNSKTPEWGDSEKADPIKVLDKFANYYLARHSFRHRKDSVGESFDHFVHDLWLLLGVCWPRWHVDKLHNCGSVGNENTGKVLDKSEDLADEISQLYEIM